MKIVAITGGIATGKSTVTAMFAELGAQRFSADEDARAALAPGSSGERVVLARFPDAAKDGTLDRARLADIIFADPAARKALESLTHPLIAARMQAAIDAARAAGEGVLVYEVPLLYESGLDSLFDVAIAVRCTPERQIERLQARQAAKGLPPLTSEQIAQRLAAQMPLQEKARRANYVISTDVPLDETRRQVEEVWGEFV